MLMVHGSMLGSMVNWEEKGASNYEEFVGYGLLEENEKDSEIIAGECMVDSLDRTLLTREQVIDMLKFHLKREQDRMKNQATGECMVDSVDRTLLTREQVIDMLKFHLKREQDRMKNQATDVLWASMLEKRVIRREGDEWTISGIRAKGMIKGTIKAHGSNAS
nr:hypothetical protein [Tanacetum cinerariifolium]